MAGSSLLRSFLDGLNALALAGWTYVLYLVCTTPSQSLLGSALKPVTALEAICVVEVVRIAVGDLTGNLVLGTILHGIRVLTLAEVLPRTAEERSWLIAAVLGSWAVTEVSRYPMYVIKGSRSARLLRMVVPIATFPIGSGAEAYAAWLVFRLDDTSPVVKGALAILIGINALLGPTMAYPVIFKKGLREMGVVKKKKVIKQV